MDVRSHWDTIFATKPSTKLGWFQPHLRNSLDLIEQAHLGATSPIIDIGSGDSTLVDDLIAHGYEDLTVLDISPSALAKAKSRLGPEARKVRWIEGDILEVALPQHRFDLWHDRALFHFLISEQDRTKYANRLLASLAPSGRVVLATFAPDGPTECSGLPARRYSPADMLKELGEGFQIEASSYEEHTMPSGARQKFAYTMLRLRG